MTPSWPKTLILAVLAAVSPAPAQDPVPETAHLAVRIIGQDGRPLSGVKAIVRGIDLSNSRVTSASSAVLGELYDPTRILHAGLLGHLELNLPVETYDFAFTRAGYYDLELRGVEIEIPDTPLRIETLETLRVMMQPRLDIEGEPESTRPFYVEAPRLQVAFRPTKPPVRSTKARGTVTLTNVGNEPLMLPQEHDFQWAPNRTLVLRVMVEVEGTDMAFDEYYGCGSFRRARGAKPELPVFQRCHSLAPGESVEMPIELRSERLYSVGLSSPTLWGAQRNGVDFEAGPYQGTVGAYLIYPHDTDERPTYSRKVEVPFQVTIKDWK